MSTFSEPQDLHSSREHFIFFFCSAKSSFKCAWSNFHPQLLQYCQELLIYSILSFFFLCVSKANISQCDQRLLPHFQWVNRRKNYITIEEFQVNDKKDIENISFICQNLNFHLKCHKKRYSHQRFLFSTENVSFCFCDWIVSKWWATGISGLIEFNQQEKLKQFIVNVHFIYKCWLSQLQSYKVTKRQQMCQNFFTTAKTKITTQNCHKKKKKNIERVRIVPKTLLLCDL